MSRVYTGYLSIDTLRMIIQDYEETLEDRKESYENLEPSFDGEADRYHDMIKELEKDLSWLRNKLDEKTGNHSKRKPDDANTAQKLEQIISEQKPDLNANCEQTEED